MTTAIHEALPVEVNLDEAKRRAQSCYQRIAQLLIELRHEFPGPNGEPHDLQGRSSSYRFAVREAYEAAASVELGVPIPKRLTAGVAYWVRKILIARYGEKALYENGAFRRTIVKGDRCSGSSDRMIEGLPQDPADRLDVLIGMLNLLAVDPRLDPSEEAVRSAFRVVLLLRDKLNDDLKNRPTALRSSSDRNCEMEVA
ncbi:MAG: hypothetical protein ACREJW_03300 [Candidatus Methylomirabilales bacterium]